MDLTVPTNTHKLLINTADNTNVKEAINVDYWNSNIKTTEQLYVKTLVLPTMGAKVSGFTTILQNTSTDNLITFTNDEITFKSGYTYQIILRIQINVGGPNSILEIHIWDKNTGLDLIADCSTVIAGSGNTTRYPA